MDSPLHASVSSLMLILVLQEQDQRARGIDTPKMNKLGEIFFYFRLGAQFMAMCPSVIKLIPSSLRSLRF